jgi:hypothetical protein
VGDDAEFGLLLALGYCVKQLNQNLEQDYNGYGKEIAQQQEDRDSRQGQVHEVQG